MSPMTDWLTDRQSQCDFDFSQLWNIRQPIRTFAEDIIKIRYQETSTEDRRIYVCCSYSDLKRV
jgi:hypothetical protein